MIDLRLGDCLDVMRGMPAGSVDAVITDPPFFTPATHYQSRVGWQRKWADMSVLSTWWATMCVELDRITKTEGHVLAFCNADSYPAFYPPMFNVWDKLVCLVWDKERPGLGRVWRHQHELVIAARHKGAYEPNDGKLRPDVLRFKATLSRDRLHPVEKPPEMLAELILATTPAGAIVFDPFMGSGTTGVACVQTGRSFIGVEIDDGYYAVSQRRIEAAQAQPAPLEMTA